MRRSSTKRRLRREEELLEEGEGLAGFMGGAVLHTLAASAGSATSGGKLLGRFIAVMPVRMCMLPVRLPMTTDDLVMT